MEEQLPTPFSNNLDNDKENLVVQPNQEMPKEVKKMTFFYGFAVFIFCIKFLFYIIIWFFSLIESAINYNYQSHSYVAEKKYFAQFNMLLFPNLILSGIIMCVGMPTLYHRYKITVIIINILLIAFKIPLFIFSYKILRKILYLDGEDVLPKIVLGFEIAYISTILIFGIITIIVIK